MKYTDNIKEDLKFSFFIFYLDYKDYLNDWYDAILEDDSNFLVFATPSSYNTALYMEAVTGKKLCNKNNAVILSDESIISYCKQIAEQFNRTGFTKSITIVGDCVEHGRTINDLLYNIVSNIKNYITDKQRFYNFFELHMIKTITICMPKHQMNLLDENLLNNSEKLVRVDDKIIYAVYSNLAYALYSFSGIFENNISNMSEIISSKDVTDKIIECKDYIRTNYMYIDNYTKVDFVGNEKENVKAILTTRLSKAGTNKVAPFILLPALSESETEKIENEILDKITTDREKFELLLKDMKDINGQRCYNDFLLMILNNAILQDFNKEFGVEQTEDDFENELERLTINYHIYGHDNITNLLREILSMKLFTLDELKGMLDRCIDPGNNVLTINNNATHVNNAGILEELNNKIYDIWYQNELAIALDVNKWPKDKNTIRRKVYGINTVFKEWFKSHDEKNTKEIIAILLQMANRGVIEITTNHKKETDITGMRQYLTIDKLAFYIIALQHYEHVSELAGIEKYCNDFKQDIKNVIRKHFAKYEEQQTGEELILYVEKLKKIYKTPSSFQARAKLHTLISTPTNINISQFNYINNKIKEDSDNYKRWENR